MSTPAVASETPKAGPRSTYGTFFLNQSEFAIDIKTVQEVVNYPEVLTSLPHSPEYLLGVFNLRGMVIPVLDLYVLLKSEVPRAANTKVAIIDQEGVRIGLAFARTGEILRMSAEQRSQFAYSKGSQRKFVQGTLRRDDGKRLTHILDATTLVTVENLPYVVAQQKEVARLQALRRITTAGDRRRCVSFRVGAHLMGCDVGAVREVIQCPQVAPSDLKATLCLGIITLRGIPLPLIDTLELLGDRHEAHDRQFAGKSVVLMKTDGPSFGLLVDKVENIITCNAEEVVAVPIFKGGRAALISGYISRMAGESVLYLDHKQLLNDPEICGLATSHTMIYRQQELKDTGRYKAQRKCYITYRLQHLAGIGIDDIDEIIPYSPDIIPSPGSAPHLRGLLSLRGKVLPIIDLRRLYGLPTSPDEPPPPVLVVQRGGASYGLVVDAVEQIMYIAQAEKLMVPKLLVEEGGEALQEDIAEVFEAPGGNKPMKLCLVLDLDRVLARAM